MYEKLIYLEQLIDEENYPYFDSEYLLTLIKDSYSEVDVLKLAIELVTIKSGISGIKLGDIEIPSPKDYFLNLSKQYNLQLRNINIKNRKSKFRMAVRADGQK